MQQYSKEEVQQVVQQAVQAAIEQVTQGSSQDIQTVKGTGQSYTKETDDIGTDETFRLANMQDAQLWGWNKKLLASKEFDYDASMKHIQLKEKELAIAERESKLRLQAKLDSIYARAAEQKEFLSHIANTGLVESQFPMRDDESESKNG